MNKVEISFITVNYNSGKKVCSLIESIRREFDAFEIIVVDNASTDDTQQLLGKIAGEDLHCVYSPENLGYGRANNLGVKQARGEYIVLINPDAIFAPGAISNRYFIQGLASSDIGLIAPRIMYPDGSTQPNFSRRYSSIQTFIPQLFSLGKLYRLLKKNGIGAALAASAGRLMFGAAGNEYVGRFEQSEAQTCAWVSGACIGMRKETYEAIGGFDDRFFLYSEDEDLCRRAAMKGLKILFDPAAAVVHEVGGTDSGASQFGKMGLAELHRIHSGLMYLSKYRTSNWPVVKVAYCVATAIRITSNCHLFFSTRRSLNLMTRLIRI